MLDWIEWKADGVTFSGPVADYIWVEYEMVDGDIWQDFAGDINWGLKGEGGEVIRYRVPKLEEKEKLVKRKELA